MHKLLKTSLALAIFPLIAAIPPAMAAEAKKAEPSEGAMKAENASFIFGEYDGTEIQFRNAPDSSSDVVAKIDDEGFHYEGALLCQWYDSTTKKKVRFTKEKKGVLVFNDGCPDQSPVQAMQGDGEGKTVALFIWVDDFARDPLLGTSFGARKLYFNAEKFPADWLLYRDMQESKLPRGKVAEDAAENEAEARMEKEETAKKKHKKKPEVKKEEATEKKAAPAKAEEKAEAKPEVKKEEKPAEPAKPVDAVKPAATSEGKSAMPAEKTEAKDGKKTEQAGEEPKKDEKTPEGAKP